MNLNNEVFPYFLISLAFLKVDLRIVFSGLIIMIIGSLWLFVDPNSRSIIDAAVLTSMLVGCSLFDRLKSHEKLKVVNVFTGFLLINFIVSVLQLVSPEFQSFTHLVFNAEYRSNVLDVVRGRNGGVTGLAPEPAYCATLVVGLGLIVSGYKPKRWFVPLLVIGSLMLLRSISGYFYGAVYLAFVIIQQNGSFRNLLIYLSYATAMLLTVVFLSNLTILDWARFDHVTSRLIHFFVLVYEYESILMAEEAFGSNRISSIFVSFSSVILPYYSTGFSPAATLNFLTGSALASVFIGLFLIVKNGRRLFYLLCLVLLFIAGPKLVWPIFYFALFGTKNYGGRNIVNRLVKNKVSI